MAQRPRPHNEIINSNDDWIGAFIDMKLFHQLTIRALVEAAAHAVKIETARRNADA